MDAKEIIESINSKDIGCQFFKVDLHVHTLASTDYKDKEIKPEDIVKTAIKKGLDIIAITDHNSVEWCKKIIEASKDTSLTVLPGFEINTQGGQSGLHFIAIFDVNKPINEIKECLTLIGMNSQKQGDLDAITTKSHSDILNIISENEGIVIGAHCHSNKGLLNGMKGGQRTEIIQNKNLKAIEISSDKEEVISFFDGKDTTYKRLLACIKCSDAHSLDEIGNTYTLLKMEKPSLEGIRQTFSDPQSRIRFNDKQLHQHPFIVGVCIEGGFLDGQIFRFNDNMNTIIGGKGTGKTTCIELIRFALGSKHKNPKIQEECQEMVEQVLGNGRIYVLLFTKDKKSYIVSREIDSEAKIMRENGEEVCFDLSHFQEFFDIEAYSQGELITIAKDIKNQLEMLDKYIDFEKLIDSENNILSSLASNASKLLTNNEEIDKILSKLERLPVLKEQIKIIEDAGLKEYTEDQKKWGDEKVKIEQIITIIKEYKKNINLENELIKQISFEDNSINKEILESINSEIDKFDKEIIGIHKQKNQIVEDLVKNTESKQSEWSKKYDQQLEKFKELTKELQDKGIDVENYLKLEEEKNKLIEEEKKKEEYNSNNKELIKKRNELFEELYVIRKALTEKRKKAIKIINSSLNETLDIELKAESNIDEYIEWMIECVKGSRLPTDSTKQLCKKVTPKELFNISVNKSEDRVDLLASKTGLNTSYFEKVFDKTSFLSKIYELQVIKLEDKLSIKLYDNGWKKLNQLSTGGKCTAILLIAMLERSTPLLIDQPEDSLDNSFIYSSVVQILRKLKDKRQLLVVTHNANIPVLGDCEQMFALTSNGLKGSINCQGAIDNGTIKEMVQKILEGGRDAFKKRYEKYGF